MLPDLDVLYGIDFSTDRARMIVLFGDTERVGFLTIQGADVPYRMVEVPRRQWSEVTLDPRALVEEIGADILPVRHREHAFRGSGLPHDPSRNPSVCGRQMASKSLSLRSSALSRTPWNPVRRPSAPICSQNRSAGRCGSPTSTSRPATPRRRETNTRWVLESRPDSGLAHLQAAEAYMRLGDLLAAFDGYDKAIEANADVGRAQLGRGAALLALNQHEESLKAYGAALSAIEDERTYLRAEALVGRSEAFMAIGDCRSARTAIQRAWALKPTMTLPREKLQKCESNAL